MDTSIASCVLTLFTTLGYAGIVAAMAIESCCIPLPSEVVMPLAGFLAFQGQFTVWGASVAGAIGCVAGSAVAYTIGATGGAPAAPALRAPPADLPPRHRPRRSVLRPPRRPGYLRHASAPGRARRHLAAGGRGAHARRDVRALHLPRRARLVFRSRLARLHPRGTLDADRCGSRPPHDRGDRRSPDPGCGLPLSAHPPCGGGRRGRRGWRYHGRRG